MITDAFKSMHKAKTQSEYLWQVCITVVFNINFTKVFVLLILTDFSLW